MKIYHTATQEGYNALMIELEQQDMRWTCSRSLPTKLNLWKNHKENTCVKIESNLVSYSKMEYYKQVYPNTPIIEYRAKQDNLSPNHYKFGDMEVRHFLDRVFKYGEFDAVSAPYVSNAIEYICRAPRKEGVEDYKKALNNLKFLIDILEEAE